MNKITDVKMLGLLIYTARKAQGLTQEQLAATCGVGIRFLRELEHGKETCHLGKSLQVVQMLGIEVFLKQRGEVS